MKKAKKYIYAAAIVITVMISAIYAPEIVSEHYDKLILGKLYTKEIDSSHSGYRYGLSNWERVFIFSNARENLASKERYTASSLKMETLRIEKLKQEYTPVNEAYALFANEKGPGSNELSQEDAIKICWEEIVKLKSLGVLPDFPASEETVKSALEAKLYSVVNIAEASKNISVWELYSVPENRTDNNLELQFELDAETGKIYSFNINTSRSFVWDTLDTGRIIENYCNYLGISEPQEYMKDDMTERTPYFKKYILENQLEREKEKFVFITIGFNPGNNLFFIRIP